MVNSLLFSPVLFVVSLFIQCKESKVPDSSVNADTMLIEKKSGLPNTLGGEDDTLISRPLHHIDTAEIIALKDPRLIEFNASRIEWSNEEIKSRTYLKPQVARITDTIWSDSFLIISAIGGGPVGSYLGNIEITDSSIYLYYWIDRSKDFALAMTKRNFIYTIANPPQRKTYHIELIRI